MRKPTIQEYRLAAWLKLYREKTARADECRENAIDNDIRGYYLKADAAAKRANEYRMQIEGMLAALFSLGFSLTEAWNAETKIQEYIKGR